jgi:hypothetical protein
MEKVFPDGYDRGYITRIQGRLRLPYFLVIRLTHDGEVISLTRLRPFTSRKISGTHMCWRLSQPQAHNTAGSVRSIEKSSHFIGNRTRDLPASSIMPQATMIPRAPALLSKPRINK